MLFVIQAPIVAHFMGEVVVEYNPTKFALMEGAETTFHDPLIALIAYGDPNKPIVGFDQFEKACLSHGNATIGDLAKALGIPAALELKTVGKIDLTGIASVKLADLCMQDLQKAKAYMPLIHTMYYTKVAFAIIGGLAAAVLFFYFYRVPVLTGIATAVAKMLGDERRRVFLLAVLLVLGTTIPAAFGWAVREIGRKPWTVYGLLYPSELVTPVPYSTSAEFLAIAYL